MERRSGIGAGSVLVALALVLAGCGASQPVPAGDVGPSGMLGGSGVTLELAGDKITRIVPGDGGGAWLSPPVIDSHVHLAFWPVADKLGPTGIAAAVDLAAPERDLRGLAGADVHVIAAGPMLTRESGYPLDSWGSDGYGIGCADAACVTATIDRLATAGAGVIKIALDDDGLDPALLPGAVAAAHARRLKVAVHALDDRSALAAAQAGVDLLAHTPVEPLREQTVRAWKGKAVISTLAAFGGNPSAIENLAKLREAGAIVLYGTDLGNTRDLGPSARELMLLRRAGLDDAAIADAMTTAPARYWGLPLGTLAPGAEASFLVVTADPRRNAEALLAPRAVWLRGRRVR
jgi:imidazolonepropionase-like amidohydrolase